MAKYQMITIVEAEQFLPEKDQIPAGVHSDGVRSPKNDPRAAWVLRTADGAVYMHPGDYVMTLPTGERISVPKDYFEKEYTKLED